MESESKHEESKHWTDSPACPQRSGASEWESIFSTVKAKVPSLDSETSSSDCEDGEVFIFQRAETNLIPDLSEELSDVTLEDLKMQEIFEPIRLIKEAWDGNLKKSEVHIARAVAALEPSEDISLESCEASPSSSSAEGPPSQQEAESVDSIRLREEVTGKFDLCCEQGSWTSLSLSTEESIFVNGNTSSGEGNKSTEKNVPWKWGSWLQQRGDSDLLELGNQPLMKNTGDNLSIDSNVERDQWDPTIKSHLDLNLQYIMQWDLDKIIQNLQEQEEVSLSSEESALPAVDLEDISEHLAANTPDRLMEQLELLCAKQSQEMSSFYNGIEDFRDTAAEFPSLREQTSSNSRKSKTVHGAKWGRLEEPPTIYIDLRNVKPQESESLSEEDEDQEADCQAEVHQRDFTGKSLLLQQLRKARQANSAPCTPTIVADVIQEEMSQNSEHLKISKALKIRRKRHLKTKGEANKITPKDSGECEAEAGVLQATGSKSPESHLPKIPTKELGSPDSMQEIESAYLSLTKALESLRAEEKPEVLIQKENQMKDKQRRQRLQAQLEKLKPRHSVSVRQPMAEKTPVLFHMEASYLPSINTLPSAENTKSEMLLMTIWLSSCGQVSSCGQHNNRTPDALLLAANVYHALVTWLLSLVLGFKVQGGSTAPFQVVGLQQAWREDGLALYACLVPQAELAVQTTLKIRGHKAKENLRGTSTFYQQTSMFLSHTWLQSIMWWREEVAHCLQDQLFPLLPEIPAIRLCNVISINPDPKAVEKAFELPCGFYWQTVETDEKYSPFGTDLGDSADTEMEVAMSVVFQTLFSNPVAFHHMLQLILSSSLDICGLRLLYPTFSTLLSSTENLPSFYSAEEGKALPPILAIALRGHKACSTFQDILGPFDPQLAMLTDRHSINAIYCKSKAEPLLYMPHTETRILWELCVWFGGRVPNNGVVQVGIQNPAPKYNRPRSESPSENEQEKDYLQDMELSRPPATLISVIKGDVFLVVSPAVPPCAYGDVISTCTRHGFSMQGIKRIRISPKRASMLSMTNSQITVFCPNKSFSPLAVKLYEEDPASEPRLHCLILMLRRENASHHVPALIKGLMNELAEHGLLRDIQSTLPHNVELDLSLCFHIVPYTDGLLQGLGGSLNTLPESGNLAEDIFSRRNYASNPETEQVVILTITGQGTMLNSGDFLRQILRPTIKKQHPDPGEPSTGFELLGLKWLPRLSQGQAKEITPFEILGIDLY
ncbi:uncharacterized protein C16orf71 homolog isoform X2 [Rhinatrema bivittatum]|uniref:uncharacterized protein C16orf71 homolog isoform X2 n=1 Tax=Rhinatrema bivittatum TaxID=194408 RepID=UPI00112B5F52|nr:uncharacterized protein C16orf71 homolog isoform X2 [Rhinatrema bivittatum]